LRSDRVVGSSHKKSGLSVGSAITTFILALFRVALNSSFHRNSEIAHYFGMDEEEIEEIWEDEEDELYDEEEETDEAWMEDDEA